MMTFRDGPTPAALLYSVLELLVHLLFRQHRDGFTDMASAQHQKHTQHPSVVM